jgi:hypothetical protein
MIGRKGGVESVIELRGNFFEPLVTTTAIALGINLAAGVLGLTLTGLWSLLLSAALIFIGCTILILRVAPRVNQKLTLEGVLCASGESKKIIHIDRYAFSRTISDAFRALFHENKAIERIWSNFGLDFIPTFRSHDDAKSKTGEAGKTLVREATEYFILKRLSLDLSAYFNNNAEIASGELVSILRNDIPSVLLSNRFLDLLSRPMDEREAFASVKTEPVHHAAISEGLEKRLIFAITKEGEIYDHLELVLPRGTIIGRPNDRSFSIDTRRFSLRFEVTFDGFSANLPADFEELYLGTKFDSVRSYVARIDIEVRFKLRSVFSRKGWQYYKWIDRFLANLESDFSFDLFLKQISWDAAYSVATIAKRSNLQHRSRKSDTAAAPNQ